MDYGSRRMGRVDRGDGVEVDAVDAAVSDRSRLHHQLALNTPNIERFGKRLKATYPAYRNSLGKDPGPVLKEIAMLSAVVDHAIRAVQRTHLATRSGRDAQRQVLGALTALERALTDLKHAFSTHNTSAHNRALNQARKSLKQCERLRTKASHALGFSWRL